MNRTSREKDDDLVGRYSDYYDKINLYNEVTEILYEAIDDPSISEDYLVNFLQELSPLPIDIKIINKAVILNSVSFFEILLRRKDLGYADETNDFLWESVVLISLKEEREDIVKLVFSYKRQDDDFLKKIFKSVFAPQTYLAEVGMHGKKTFVKVVVDLNISLPRLNSNYDHIILFVLVDIVVYTDTNLIFEFLSLVEGFKITFGTLDEILSFDREKFTSVFSAEDLFVLFGRYLQDLSTTSIESLFGLCLQHGFKDGIVASLWLYDDSLRGIIDETSDYDTILMAAISVGLFLKLDNDKVSGISLYSRRILDHLLRNSTDKDIVIEFLNNSEGFELSFVDCDNSIIRDDIDLTPQQLFDLLKFCPEFDVGVETYFHWYFSEEMITEKPGIVSAIVSRYKGLSEIDFSFGQRLKALYEAIEKSDVEQTRKILRDLKNDCPLVIIKYFIFNLYFDKKITEEYEKELIDLIEEYLN